MRIAGFNFKKISVEKTGEKAENLKVNTKVDIPNIKILKPEFVKTKDELLQIDFEYIVDYEPDFAKIEIIGNVIVALDSKNAKEVVKHWEDKEMSDELRMSLFNIILRKSNIKALELEDEMNLPLHIPFPPLKIDNKKEN
ncbi:hypothetical protein KAT24_00255 [Candidatus Pacearchaeota archaeon]|nr:hypothetical protein [Candidatus Pacearchaeota archaeon]